MKIQKTLINLPPTVNVVIWKNRNNKKMVHINLLNKSKNLGLVITTSKNKFKFDKNTNSVIVTKQNFNHETNKVNKFFFNFIKSWDIFFFNKIKFKGKGFRMRFFKKNKFVKFFFGKSHKTFMFFKKIVMKRINKYKFILKSLHKNKVLRNCKMVTKIKPLNIYTLRGLKISRQIIFKRKGKKGTYI